jgi:lactoylglutathione lyase
MKIRYVHTNIISKDWRSLANFYIEVFGCTELAPQRDLSGEWVDRLSAIKDAHISGVHLLLPGWGDDGPTLEIFSYDTNEHPESRLINTEGFGHIAFAVEDVRQCLDRVIAHGGSQVGKLIDGYVEGVGSITLVYARDPEGNIIEIQRWE